MAQKINGAILYRGPSLLDGSPIVAIVTGLAGKASANAKTGAMLQTWILRADVDPFEAVKNGADASVCGDCKHRPITGGACYVRVYQAPKSVWKCYQRGGYGMDVLPLSMIRATGAGRSVRIGSYGDPSAVPASVWHALVADAAMHTGYTHQWANAALDAYQRTMLRDICMASADTPSERDAARSAGWRTFTVRLASDALAQREAVCPASKEAGAKINCQTCGACNGAGTGRKGSIAILAHGALAGRYIAIRAA